jgi:uncharacterized membrane protein
MSENPFDVKTVLLAKHAQHVVLIHFPIALFTAAVAFHFLALVLSPGSGLSKGKS